MSKFAKEITIVNIEDEMQQSYLDYAMSVIVGRALPDVRDGLKPVHRRVLYAMSVLGNDWNKSYKKSARIVGDVIGKYHPHGDTAVYDTIVRMAQPFSLRYMLVDGQGNFGSVDGDSPAAMRYTEVRMAKIAHEMLADLDKETVNFASNYDDSESEPTVLPARVPALLVNGSSGIAVGMATNIPPHNLGEVISGCLALIENPEISTRELMNFIKAPDFPTAGIINGLAGAYDAYTTGRGRVDIRARSHVEDYNNGTRQAIIVTELPYQVNKARLLEKIAELIKESKIEGISGLRDESDKDGMRMVIEIRRGEVPEVVLNNLYKQTQLRTIFSMNMVAIIDGRPKCMNLKEILHAFVSHRREVVTRRTVYLLRKARERAHVLEGLAVAMSNIDEMILLIKAAKNPAEAKKALLDKTWQGGLVAQLLENVSADSRPEELSDDFGLKNGEYHLSTVQVAAILELRLHRLTGLEQNKIVDEYKQLLIIIDEYLTILGSRVRLTEVICEELTAIKDEYQDERRTELVADTLSLSEADFITEEDVVVTMSHEGYVKSQRLDDYQAQRRGGRGKSATATKEEDFIEKLVIANTHDTLLCFSSTGKVYGLKVYQLPIASRASKGKPFVNLLSLEKDEQINAMLTVREYSESAFIFMATASGTVKKTPLKEFERQPSKGKVAIKLLEGDTLVGVSVTDGEQQILLFSNNGKANCFKESDVRSMGRNSIGVRGMRLEEGQKIISLITSSEGAVLNVTENGYAKRTALAEFTCHKRGGKGMIAIQTSERNGQAVAALLVEEHDELMLITNGGVLVRTRVNEINIIGRNAQGVKAIRLGADEKVVGVDKIDGLVDDDSVGSDDSETELTPVPENQINESEDE